MTKSIKNTIAAAGLTLALVAGFAPTAAFAADASELPPAVAMAAATNSNTTQVAARDAGIATFADSICTLIDADAAKIYLAQAEAQGLDAETALITVYSA